MEKTATLNLRINPGLKQDAESVLNRLGIPMSTAVDMFLHQVVLVGGIPFDVMLPQTAEKAASSDRKKKVTTEISDDGVISVHEKNARNNAFQDSSVIGQYDSETGLPTDKTYLELGLPPYLHESMERMIKCWERIDKGEEDSHWDAYWGELNSDINVAESEGSISQAQAGHLRRKFLRMG